MMIISQQLLSTVVVIFSVILFSAIFAEQTGTEATINNLYDSLLQREYAGPALFPNLRYERKAQRSPSLRLRFGRSDQSMPSLQAIEKRWFGDVNQKPIRSPSLRLRFGRRSDPSMPLEHSLDDEGDFDNYAFDRPNFNLLDRQDLPIEDYDLPQRFQNDELTSSEKVKYLLNILQQVNEIRDNYDDFKRVIRKPGPIRLRWGRSTGGASDNEMHEMKQQEPDHKADSLIDNQINTVPATNKA